MRAPRSIATVLLATLAVVGMALAGSPAQAATPYHASVGTTGLDQAKIAMGKTVTISGKVWGGPVKNQKVSIYLDNINAPGAFTRPLAVVPIDSTNRYTYKWKTDDSGVFQLRVVKGAYQGHAAVKVTSKAITVFRYVSNSPGSNADGQTVDGVVQPSSAFVLGNGQTVDMSNGLVTCRAMKLQVGVTDTSIFDGELVFYNAEAESGEIFRTNVVKGAPMRTFTYTGQTAYDGSAFTADFGVSGSSFDSLVLRYVKEDCAKPVKNQWNPTGAVISEGLQYWCVGEQVLRAEDPKCKN